VEPAGRKGEWERGIGREVSERFVRVFRPGKGEVQIGGNDQGNAV